MKKINSGVIMVILTLIMSGCALQTDNDTTVKPQVDKIDMNQKTIERKERTDEWSPKEDLSTVVQGITLEPSKSEPIRISFEERKLQGPWDSYKGGAEAEYAFASIDGDQTDAVRLVVDGFNEWAVNTSKDELEKAKDRWDMYHASDPDSFIALTPWVGLKLTRSDTSIISFVTTIRRYNRDYEPDDDFLNGHTYDAQTGKELLLNDFVTDPEKLSDVLTKTMAVKCLKYSDEKKEIYLDEGFKKRVRDSVAGSRDDGLFAWSVGPTGFVFYLADPFYKEDYLYYQVEDFFVPFELCRDFLSADLDAPYDYVSSFPKYYLTEIYGENVPEGVGGKTWFSPYSVQKDGQKYLYLSGDNELDTYKVADGGLQFVGSVTGNIYDGYHYTYESIIDPGNIEMEAEAFLLVELLQLRADAVIGKDGAPEYKELFKPEYNVFPMMVLEEFEAEVFSDEKDATPKKKVLKPYTELYFLRTDAKTFIDLEIEGNEGICRLYITGNYEDGFMVNGYPAKEVIQEELFFEE
jgi:hypothetical protein